MPCIVRDGTFNVYVYANDHPLPHCHAFWAGDQEALVDLGSLTQTQGVRLPRAGMALIRAHVGELSAAWDRLNPEEA